MHHGCVSLTQKNLPGSCGSQTAEPAKFRYSTRKNIFEVVSTICKIYVHIHTYSISCNIFKSYRPIKLMDSARSWSSLQNPPSRWSVLCFPQKGPQIITFRLLLRLLKKSIQGHKQWLGMGSDLWDPVRSCVIIIHILFAFDPYRCWHKWISEDQKKNQRG